MSIAGLTVHLMTTPTPYDNAGHTERATYRAPGLRITLVREGYATSKSRPWQVVIGDTVTTRAGHTAIEAMREAGQPDPSRWTYTPGMG